MQLSYFFKGYFFLRLLIIVFICLGYQQLIAQNISNEGSDFWICFPSHVPSDDQLGNPRLATMSVFITSKSNSTGKVTCGNWSEDFSVQANTVTEVLVPRVNSYIENGTGTNIDKAIRVKVDDGMPKVVAYAHVFAGARSAASLVLPTEALGQKYYAVSYTQSSGGLSQFNIIATEAQTTVKITPVTNKMKRSPIVVTLENVGDVYQYQNGQDITGSLIEVDNVNSACKKIAVFSGSSTLVIKPVGCNDNGSSDPLFQQLYPVESWGRLFSLIPFSGRENGSIFRFLASEDNTEVTYNGIIRNLNEGEFYESPPTYSPSIVISNKPITVTQYALTQICADNRNRTIRNGAVPSDPDMVILNPLEYSINSITLYSSEKLEISEQFINVSIPTLKTNTFTINNVNMGRRFVPFTEDPRFSYAKINLREIGGTNFSLAADTGFNAIAYGFGSFESYAYSAGTNLASTKVVNILKSGSDVVVNDACIFDSFDFKLTLPYITNKIIWKINLADPEVIVDTPPYTERINGDRILYEYVLRSNTLFNTSGLKNVVITVSPPTTGNVCNIVDDDIINFQFEVFDLPVANFALPAVVCTGEDVNFTYTEMNIGKPVNSWLWDFGDGKTSTLRDPVHVYDSPGIYKVKLIIKSNIGCVSNAVEKEIRVLKLPAAAFETTSPLCVNTAVGFKDLSVSEDDLINSWVWDFGDNSTLITGAKTPTHVFLSSGTYNVKLTVKTVEGCENTIIQQVVIKDPAEINFTHPASCINDIVEFRAETIKGNVASWEWDFGDGRTDNIEKTKANPTHKYLSTGIYNVSLKAVSIDGCVTTITKAVTISGANPNVSFEVLDQNSLCSNRQVLFKNTSTIGFGEITKLEWLLDFDNNQTITITDNNPEFDEIYSYNYPLLGVHKTYKVVLRAYSGLLCFTQSQPISITVNASPRVIFENVSPVCLNASPFLLQASDANGIAGSFKFEGNGVTGVNTFNPALAGVGDHTITYSYLTIKGCVDTLRRVIRVNDLPELDEVENLDILLKGEKQIALKILSGTNLTYKWSPSIGLSADNVLNPIAFPDETTNYTLTITNTSGCSTTKELTVTVHIDPNIPNAFSPNGDGINDYWSIKYLETFVVAYIKIFNRYGQEVFYSKRYTDAWDGKHNGVEMPLGVYYYIIEPNNGRNKYTGSITLIR